MELKPVTELKIKLPGAIQNQVDRANQANAKLAQINENIDQVNKELMPGLVKEETPAEPAPTDIKTHPDYAALEHRFKVVEGLLKKANADSKTKVESLRSEYKQQIATLEASVEELQSKQAIDLVSLGYTEDEIAEHGRDFLEKQIKVARNEAKRVAPKRKEEEIDAAYVQKDDNEDFFEELTGLVPNWRAINVLPAWLAWLGENEDERQLILDGALQRGKVKKVQKLFEDFLESQKPAKVEREKPPITPTQSSAVHQEGSQPNVAPEKALTDQELSRMARRIGLGQVSGEEVKKFHERVYRERGVRYAR